MSEEGFFKRWSRLKATGGDVAEPARPAATVPPVPAAPTILAGQDRTAAAPPARPAPTLEDVAGLTPESDFSAFVGQGVDKSVQRLALKKLFADPHFKVMDGLDMYMDDYNKPSPVSAAMLAALDHARSALRHPDAAEEDTAADAAADTSANRGPDLASTPDGISALQPKEAPENIVDAYTPGEHGTGMPAVSGAAAIPAGRHPHQPQGGA